MPCRLSAIRIIVSLTFGILVQSVSGQSQYLRFRHLQQENGLKNSSIHSICQDDKGFIWIGTEGGLFRYDGFRFKVFTHNPNDTNSLNSNVVFALHNDNNNLWIGTYRGLMIYNQLNDQFIDLNLSERYLPGQTIPVNAIVKSPDGEIWIGCQDIGVVIYNPETREFDDVKAGRINRYLKNKVVNSILFDSGNNCWIGTMTQGAIKYVPNINQPVYYDFSSYSDGKLNCNEVFNIYESTNREIWIATRGGGVFLLNNEHQIKEHFTHSANDMSSIGSNEAYDFRETLNSEIWVSTNGGGLNLYNEYTGTFNRIKHKAYDKYSLINDNIRELFEDKQGNLWIASFQGGLNIHINSPYKFSHFYFPPEETTEYRSSTVLSLYAEKNTIWVGTDGGGLKKINRKSGEYSTFLPGMSRNSIPDKAVTKIFKDYQGNFWIGTYLGGLAKFDEKTGKFITYAHNPADKSSLSHNFVTDIFEDRRGNFWVATNGGGLNLFDKEKGKFKHFLESETDPENTLATNYVVCLQEDYNGDIWVGTYWGLSRLDIRNLGFTNYTFEQNKPGSLSNNVVLSILKDSRDRLWVGTRMGLNLYDRENNSFIIYTENDGLAGSTINGILEDQKGNIWISTNNGISKFNPLTGNISNFYVEDGLQGNEFYHGACYKSSQNEFFFGGYNGFNNFYPESIKENNYEPDVILTGLRVFEEEVPIGKDENGHVILNRNIAETEQLNLRYSDKNITLNFAAIDYIEGAKSVFAFKMEGFDEDWRYTTPEHPFATYTNLGPNNYTFIIKAGKPEIIDEIEKYTEIEIYIKPPFWRTWLAYIVYVLLLSYLIFYFWQLSIQRVKEKNQIKLEKMRREQIESVTQARMSFYTNISHDIRTPLTLIIGPLEQLLGKGKETSPYRKQLDIMLKNARRLLRLINQLLDFRKIEIQKMKLNAEKSDLARFITDIIYSFEEFAVEKQINFKFETSCEKCDIWFDPDKIDKAMFNLISNAFKYTPEKGQITVSLKSNVKLETNRNTEYAEITVSDNGKGIPKKDLNNIFERFYQGNQHDKNSQQGWGLGLSLSKNYIDLHQGEIKVESIENAGTVFKVYLPLGEGHLSDLDKIVTTEPGINKYIHLSTDAYRSNEQTIKDKPSSSQNAAQILIIEDNIDLRDFLIEELEPYYNCFEANNGKEGHEIAIELMPDIIISDIMMPEMDGYQLCKSLKENIVTSHIPIILLTAKTGVDDQITGLETGADAYISKPFRPDRLIANINSILDNRQRLKERFGTLKDFSGKNIKDTADSKFLGKANKTIESNLSNSLFGVNEMAQELGMSRVHLHRKMKAIAGIGPNEFIRKIRLQKAAELLLKEDSTISEISEQTGFNSTTYFSSCFKAQYKLSPKEFLDKSRK